MKKEKQKAKFILKFSKEIHLYHPSWTEKQVKGLGKLLSNMINDIVKGANKKYFKSLSKTKKIS